MKKLFAAWLLLALSVHPQQEKLFDQIDSAASELASLTGLGLKRKVQRDFISRDRLKVYLEEKVRDLIKPEEIRAEELTLKKFGFVPADFDLKKTTIDLLAEQAAAFYDFRRKKLFVLEGNSDEMQRMALVHEMAHAISDQHFNLEKFISKVNNDDGAMARGAIMEGQAQWLMFEHMARRMGATLKDRPDLLNLVSGGVEGAGQFPELDKTPLYMRETLLFPYQAGMRFMHAVQEKLGTKAFSEVFRKPPASTQHILHPEVYFEGRRPTQPPLPRTRTKGYETLAEGSIGELDHSILLRQFADRETAERIAPHWRGGRYRLLEHKQRKDLLLEYSVEWSGETTARDYSSIYRSKVLPVKYKQMQVSSDGADRFEATSEDGRIVLERKGVTVSCVEGIR